MLAQIKSGQFCPKLFRSGQRMGKTCPTLATKLAGALPGLLAHGRILVSEVSGWGGPSTSGSLDNVRTMMEVASNDSEDDDA